MHVKFLILTEFLNGSSFIHSKNPFLRLIYRLCFESWVSWIFGINCIIKILQCYIENLLHYRVFMLLIVFLKENGAGF